MESRNFIPHENFDEKTIRDDIGLIVFEEPVELNEFINVVALPARESIDDYEGKITN